MGGGGTGRGGLGGGGGYLKNCVCGVIVAREFFRNNMLHPAHKNRIFGAAGLSGRSEAHPHAEKCPWADVMSAPHRSIFISSNFIGLAASTIWGYVSTHFTALSGSMPAVIPITPGQLRPLWVGRELKSGHWRRSGGECVVSASIAFWLLITG